jgi:hypothetical protein
MKHSRVMAGFVAFIGLMIATFFTVTPTANGASVAPYPPPTCSLLSVSTTLVSPGDTITVTGTSFVAKSHVKIIIVAPRHTLANVTVSAAGTFSVDVTIPHLSPGSYVLTATSSKLVCPVDPLQLTVPGATSGGGHTPASTGVDVLLLLSVAGLLTIVGIGMSTAGRRTRGAHRA